ncbi:hypothetical protein SAMN04488569_104916 [Marinilactibacillus piezotolerans]|uniref:Sce7726 family protein n=1 Tax=Marinilactibacillus piezotolerans TaxID=258723 RepID=A0A1I4AHY2_9LACT|nr:sce7726 family protein [Marinilactibacillus piezotolerans]SFK56038.1 hypothetical protein SAMN04488569_104916 [Marinilactibacillus piezotolerans]
MNKNLLINRVFSQSTLNDVVNKNESAILSKAYQYFSNSSGKSDISFVNQFQEVYSYIEKEYRNEYFFKNTLLNKLLLGVHSINTTTALAELPISQSVADFVLINGKAVVYEIKTEYDNLTKVEKQVEDYYKVFDHVVIISVEKYKEKLLEKFEGSPVGISILTPKNTISLKKYPDRNTKSLDYKTMYKLLRQHERETILLKELEELPETNQFKKFDDYYQEFKKIPMEILYNHMLIEMKKRTNLIDDKEFFLQIPYEMRALYYFSKLSRTNKQSLKSKLEGE